MVISVFLLSSTCFSTTTAGTLWLVQIHMLKSKYLDLEIGDIINFSNFPSDLKAYGRAISLSDYFIVNEISKTPNSIDIKCTEVS